MKNVQNLVFGFEWTNLFSMAQDIMRWPIFELINMMMSRKVQRVYENISTNTVRPMRQL